MQPDGRKQSYFRQQLPTQLSQRRDPVMPALPPDFQGAISVDDCKRMRRVPVWLSAGIALLAMLTLFGLYSHRMDVQTVTAATVIIDDRCSNRAAAARAGS